MTPRIPAFWHNFPMLRAIVAQLVAFALLMGIAAFQVFLPFRPHFYAWPGLQGILATILSRRLGLRGGWLLFQFLMPFAVFWHLEHSLPPWTYPTILLLLLLTFGGGLLTRVPLYNSNQSAWNALLKLINTEKTAFLDLGAGLGGLLKYLAIQRPDCIFKGVETSPLIFLVAWLRNLHCKNCQIRLKSLWHEDLSPFHIVFAFLSPVPMSELWKKACREMKPGTLFISHSFEIPGVAPASRLPLRGRKDACLLVYRVPAQIV